VARQATLLALANFWFVVSFAVFVMLKIIMYECKDALKEENRPVN